MRRLPKITDERIIYHAARIQFQPGFDEFKAWLFGEARDHLVAKMQDAKEDSEMRNYQGALQVLSDLRATLEDAKERNNKL